jgi:hypothetical protein
MVGWLGQAQLLEEDAGQLPVIMLSGVDYDLFNTWKAAQCRADDRRLDELGASSNYRCYFEGQVFACQQTYELGKNYRQQTIVKSAVIFSLSA